MPGTKWANLAPAVRRRPAREVLESVPGHGAVRVMVAPDLTARQPCCKRLRMPQFRAGQPTPPPRHRTKDAGRTNGAYSIGRAIRAPPSRAPFVVTPGPSDPDPPAPGQESRPSPEAGRDQDAQVSRVGLPRGPQHGAARRDVVVVLLIFLMLAGGVCTTERAAPAGGAAPAGAPRRPAPGRGWTCTWAGLRTRGAVNSGRGYAGGGESRDADSLSRQLDARRRWYAAAGTPPAAVRVLIHPGPGVRWGPMAEAHDAARRAGFGRVSFVQVPGPAGPARNGGGAGRPGGPIRTMTVPGPITSSTATRRRLRRDRSGVGPPVPTTRRRRASIPGGDCRAFVSDRYSSRMATSASDVVRPATATDLNR